MLCAGCVHHVQHRSQRLSFTSEETEEKEAARSPQMHFDEAFIDVRVSDEEDYEGLSNSHGHDDEYRSVINPVTETTSI